MPPLSKKTKQKPHDTLSRTYPQLNNRQWQEAKQRSKHDPKKIKIKLCKGIDFWGSPSGQGIAQEPLLKNCQLF
jgi:hypothetical protein